MPTNNWDEIKSALYVARHGALTHAAQRLGVHHSTVLRHVEALEQRLGTRLFYRHNRGYTLTPAGRRFMDVADRMEQTAAEIVMAAELEQDVQGALVMTTVPILSGIVADAADYLLRDHPGLSVRAVTVTQLLRLEMGEADIALRPGQRPEEQDYVVTPMPPVAFALYASRLYPERHPGLTNRPLSAQRYISTEGEELRADHYRWLSDHVPPEQIVAVSADPATRLQILVRGAGCGFLPVRTADRVGTLIQLAPPRREWALPMWLLTHRDTHRTARVSAAVRVLKRCIQNYSLPQDDG
ncbi:MAG: LysR family transcriptional regulator [Paracoccus sp. (in: a-proteobacteria)]|uniref:LysR family transcriptional regulator n=1 Tax=Paracoccus sp. TaxID=267 RepID=UPI0026DF8A9D|nr:LysR family transcriptional regulator [Paracoccus sp. (in: a-proteobacteria)]MDO5612865.1 LysR family transcriptional regulator [Paracoccus sp. (in: a-proteobacteria)]